MDGIGSFGLPGGLSAIPAQLDNSDDKRRRRKTSKSERSQAVSATATTSTSRRSSSSTSSSATSRSSVACYPLFQSLARKGGETEMGKKRSGENKEEDLSSIKDSDDDDDNDEVPLASLAGSRSKGKGKGSKTSSGLRIGESNANDDRRGSNNSSTKRRKLVESRSSSDVSSTTSARHNTHQRQQLPKQRHFVLIFASFGALPPFAYSRGVFGSTPRFRVPATDFPSWLSRPLRILDSG